MVPLRYKLQMCTCAGMLTCVCEHTSGQLHVFIRQSTCVYQTRYTHITHGGQLTTLFYASDISGLAHFNHLYANSPN